LIRKSIAAPNNYFYPIGAKEILMPNNLFPRQVDEVKTHHKQEKGIEKAKQFAQALIDGTSRCTRCYSAKNSVRRGTSGLLPILFSVTAVKSVSAVTLSVRRKQLFHLNEKSGHTTVR